MKYKMSQGIKVLRNKNGVYQQGITVAIRSVYGHHHSYVGEEKCGAPSSRGQWLSCLFAWGQGGPWLTQDSIVIGVRLKASLGPSMALGNDTRGIKAELKNSWALRTSKSLFLLLKEPRR